ncbi:energy-coupling factor transporter ATPase [Paenactinomyces guangxiensis]|uniref:Energy-coupling factor transporter ATP-binding protein EcfA2 n=1 Tax=Paenactinomyces guangxiensis TaxID=1490290 RepID=A0A7W2AA71_9BACL|nr:energy-coupling factor transporter ATPase [Paenactinomyces guangxiensis]MBA4495919.1 energy-coupling factor transporter ATPase [Paenactinomyces guangxiensis]MBH8592944.1 energy-coupling factor transporter ATPase [Paenactinomyces guangxiensis]
MEILIEGLSHVYMPGTPFSRQALSDIHMQIKSGSFVAILGPTGSGKSTLIQLISGLMRPTRGKIHAGPHVVTGEAKNNYLLRQHIGVVFQYPEHQLFEETVAKDIAFGPRNQGLTETEIIERVDLAMKWVGLPPELAGRSPFQLSGGQMRRVAIAGVLAMQPDVLILDEPTAGLDHQGQQNLLETIHRLHQERRFTVIMVTHNMDEAARYAEYLYILSEGRCVLGGAPADIFSQREKLMDLKLDLPELTKLVFQLNQKLDPPLPSHLFHPDELERELLARKLKEGTT